MANFFLLALLALFVSASALVQKHGKSPSPSSTHVNASFHQAPPQFEGPMTVSRTARRQTMSMEYIPDGLSKAQWAKIKEKETGKKIGKFDGTSGMKFRSRSFEDFQRGREAGTITPNMVSHHVPCAKRWRLSHERPSAAAKEMTRVSYVLSSVPRVHHPSRSAHGDGAAEAQLREDQAD